MSYEYPSYWRELHHAHPGSLKAVGHPGLSESLNELKYASEAAALGVFLDSNRGILTREAPLRVLDIGAGTGYWTSLLQSWYRAQGAAPKVTAVDLSEQALATIRSRLPGIETVPLDLATVDASRFRGMFGLAASFYCLHHLLEPADFLNGLRFAATSVAPRGVLLLMDPILSRPYSPYHDAPFSNGMPRSLAMLDEALDREGLDRIAFAPAVSFLLNGSIEARSRAGFALTTVAWKLLQRIYPSERITRALAGALARADAFLKRRDLAFSSSLAAWRKRS